MITVVESFAAKAETVLATLVQAGAWHGEAPEGTEPPLIEWEHDGSEIVDIDFEHGYTEVARFIVRCFGTAADVTGLLVAIQGVLNPPTSGAFVAGFLFDGNDAIERFERPQGGESMRMRCLHSRNKAGQLQFAGELTYEMRVTRRYQGV